MRKYKLSPSILAAKLLELPNIFNILNGTGIDSIHIDVMDGQFVDNLTIGPSVIKEIRTLTNLTFHAHLMILTPEKLIKEFLNSGVDMPIFHIEATSKISTIIDIVKGHNRKVGIAINPRTQVEKIFDYLKLIDAVLIMTVNPGFYGRGIILEPLNKIQHIRDKNPNIEVIVDGGVRLSNVEEVLRYNPTTIVSSSEIFLSNDIKGTINKFLSLLN